MGDLQITFTCIAAGFCVGMIARGFTYVTRKALRGLIIRLPSPATAASKNWILSVVLPFMTSRTN